MSRHRGFYQYAVCDARADDGHPCPAFIAPAPVGDPSGPGHVFADHLAVTLAGREAGWLMHDDGRTLCPQHRPDKPAEPRPAAPEVVDLLSLIPTGGPQ